MNDITNHHNQTNSNNNGDQEKKKGALSLSSCWKTMKHSVSNASARTLTGSKNTKEVLKIKQLEVKLEQRKKEFGVQYMDLMLLSTTSEVELQECVDKALADVTRLSQKKTKFQGYIVTNKDQLERKLHQHGQRRTTATTTSPSIEVTSAEFVVAPPDEEDPSSTSMAGGSATYSAPHTVPVNRNEEHDDEDDDDGGDDVTAMVANGSISSGRMMTGGTSTESSLPFDEDDGPLPYPTPSAPIEEEDNKEKTTMQSIVY